MLRRSASREDSSRYPRAQQSQAVFSEVLEAHSEAVSRLEAQPPCTSSAIFKEALLTIFGHLQGGAPYHLRPSSRRRSSSSF